MAVTVYANNPSAQRTASSDSSSGSETGWAMTGSTFPAASATAVPPTQFHIADPAAPSEVILVTTCDGTATPSMTVTRGAEGTTPVTHSAGATFYQIVSAGDLTAMKQAVGAITTPVNVANVTTETVVCTYQPVTGEIQPGTTFELVATGTIQTTSTPSLAWNIRWGGTGGASILSMATGTNCPALVANLSSAGCSFDVNGTVTFIDTTHCIANINFWWQYSTTTYEGVASNGTSVVVSGSGPLVLTAKWNSSSTNHSGGITVPAPLVYRAA